ncbi:MAG TPA: glycine cleavage system protein H, partial [Chloroflexota bacterium]
VNGEVLEVNEALADQPELVNVSPYDQAWMIKVRMSNPADLDYLLSASDYEKLTAEESR